MYDSSRDHDRDAAFKPERCSDCGAQLRSSGLCRRCVLQLADALFALPSRIADFDIVRELGRGSMGTVYLAQQSVPAKRVALKVLREELLLDERVVRAFADEIEILGQLEHPNIVSIFDGKGLHHRPAFFVMRWIDGSTLDDPAQRARFPPREAAQLMINVSGAIQFAHQRGVLHRDLKPSNILIDADGEPYVSDFGLARFLEGGALPAQDAVAGSLGFMSPEQARATQHEITVASDVYALGAVLYDLLTGAPPRRPRNLAHLSELFRSERLAAPHELVPGMPRDLSRVCMCALEQDPRKRYRSAAELADDLRRVIQRKPPEPPNATKPGELARLLYTARRRKGRLLLGLSLLMLLLYIPFLPRLVERNLTEQIREHNRNLAHAQAGAVMNELRSIATRVRAIAVDPNVARLVEWDSVTNPPEALSDYASEVDVSCVFKPEGKLVARYPKPNFGNYKTLDFGFRDYFAGQRQIEATSRDQVYVSRAFFSTGDRRLVFGLSAPIFDARGVRTGAVLAGVMTRSTFGAVSMGPGNGMTALLGLRDRDSAQEPMPATLRVLAAPGLAQGEDLSLDSSFSRSVCSQLSCVPKQRDQFSLRSSNRSVVVEGPDPITGTPLLASFAQVGGTGILVMVATPRHVIEGYLGGMRAVYLSNLWKPILASFVLMLLIGFMPGADRLPRWRWRSRP